jgi:hypothetical protein
MNRHAQKDQAATVAMLSEAAKAALEPQVKPHQLLDPQNHLTCTTEV